MDGTNIIMARSDKDGYWESVRHMHKDYLKKTDKEAMDDAIAKAMNEPQSLNKPVFVKPMKRFICNKVVRYD